MIYPNTTFAGQKVTICNRYVEHFRQEANNHPSGINARSLRLEFNALMPEAYHSHRLIWLHTKWKDVLNGNDDLGFPGVPLGAHLSATAKKNEVLTNLRTFYKYQREVHGPTVKRLLHERHKAEQECRQDTTHNPNLSSFKRENGKLRLDVPSKNPRNESTNAAFAMRTLELNGGMDNEHRMAISEALADAKQQTRNNDFWDNKLDKELVRVNINLPEPPDPLEDFTTYTEFDPLSKVAVTSSTITGVGISRDEDTRVFKDKTIGHFSADFTHLVDITIDNDINFGAAIGWALTNDIDDIGGLVSANKSFLYLSFLDGNAVFLVESDGGTLHSDFTTLLTEGQKHYYTLDRDEGVGSFGQLLSLIHTDVDRTVSLDTLSVLLHAKLDLRYVFGLNTNDDNEATRFIDITVENLDLQEAIAAAGRRRRMLMRRN